MLTRFSASAKILPAYTTALGEAYCGDSLDLLPRLPAASIDLVFTSPPFALQRQKEYGNKDQAEYIHWLARSPARSTAC